MERSLGISLSLIFLILEEEGCGRDENFMVRGALPRTSKASDFLTSLSTIKLTVLDLTLSYSLLKDLLNGDIFPPRGTSDLVTLRLTPRICVSNKLQMKLVLALGPRLGAVHSEHPQRNKAVTTIDVTSSQLRGPLPPGERRG